MQPNYYASEYTLSQVNDNIIELNNSINAFNTSMITMLSVIVISIIVIGIEGFFDTCLNSRK